MAIGAELARRHGSVAVLEQHELPGMETTARNSEVIHAGLYYPANSLKGKLCVRGKELIYRLDPNLVGFQKCGKWVVAQLEQEGEYLEKLVKQAAALGVPTNMVLAAQCKKEHPLIRAEFGALDSPTTGIVSAHDLTLSHQANLENHGGTLALNTAVKGIEFEKGNSQYRIYCSEKGSGEPFEITADNVINSAGLYAQQVSNMLLPPERHFTPQFAKGSYYSYAPEKPIPTSSITSRLIYPCPNPNASSLGTHLTFDLGGQLRFGPDLEWVDSKNAADLDYEVNTSTMDSAVQAIATYYPLIRREDLQPSYAGVRPKLLSREQNFKQFADFYIKQEDGFPGFVNLIGIESPGLTSSLAIGEHVAELFE